MDKYGLIGYPLVHSFSKSFFNEKFQNEDIDAEYINFEIKTIDDLPEVLATNPELKGLNVGGAIVLVACIGDGRPDLADHHILRFRIAVFVDAVFRISNFHQMPEISGMRIALKVFISSQSGPPPQNILSVSRYG